MCGSFLNLISKYYKEVSPLQQGIQSQFNNEGFCMGEIENCFETYRRTFQHNSLNLWKTHKLRYMTWYTKFAYNFAKDPKK